MEPLEPPLDPQLLCNDDLQPSIAWLRHLPDGYYFQKPIVNFVTLIPSILAVLYYLTVTSHSHKHTHTLQYTQHIQLDFQ